MEDILSADEIVPLSDVAIAVLTNTSIKIIRLKKNVEVEVI